MRPDDRHYLLPFLKLIIRYASRRRRRRRRRRQRLIIFNYYITGRLVLLPATWTQITRPTCGPTCVAANPKAKTSWCVPLQFT